VGACFRRRPHTCGLNITPEFVRAEVRRSVTDYVRFGALPLKSASTSIQAATSSMSVASSEGNTLYVKNLSEKIPKQGELAVPLNLHIRRRSEHESMCAIFLMFYARKWNSLRRVKTILCADSCAFSPPPPTELRRALFSVFSTCGRILEVVVARTYKLRGQAWIVYDRAQEAQSALQALQGFPFYDKPMVRFQSFPL